MKIISERKIGSRVQLLFILSCRWCLLHFKGIHIKRNNLTKPIPKPHQHYKFPIIWEAFKWQLAVQPHFRFSVHSRETLSQTFLFLCSRDTPPGVHPDVGPPQRKHTDLLEQVQSRPQRRSKGWSTSCDDGLGDLGLFSLEKKGLQGDLAADSQYLKGLQEIWRETFDKDMQ